MTRDRFGLALPALRHAAWASSERGRRMVSADLLTPGGEEQKDRDHSCGGDDHEVYCEQHAERTESSIGFRAASSALRLPCLGDDVGEGGGDELVEADARLLCRAREFRMKPFGHPEQQPAAV